MAAERLFVLGDAAGYIEPFTGEGIAWALEGAAALAPLAARASRRWEPDLASHWQALYRRIIGRRQLVCRGAAQVLRRPRLTGAIVAILARTPWLAVPVVQFLSRSALPFHRHEYSPSPPRSADTGEGTAQKRRG